MVVCNQTRKRMKRCENVKTNWQVSYHQDELYLPSPIAFQETPSTIHQTDAKYSLKVNAIEIVT